MNRLFLLSILLSSVFLISCADEKTSKRSDGSEFNPDELTRLKDEVMRIHDEVMPKMSDIEKMKSRVKNRLDSSEQYPDSYVKELKTAYDGLERADKAMWDWMYTYNLDSVKGETEKKLYLVEERAEIREVKAYINNSIDYAKQTLQNEPKNE